MGSKGPIVNDCQNRLHLNGMYVSPQDQCEVNIYIEYTHLAMCAVIQLSYKTCGLLAIFPPTL